MKARRAVATIATAFAGSLLLVRTAPAAAAPVTFTFTGHIGGFQDKLGLFNASIAPGAPASGSYTFDLAAPDTDPDYSVGRYQHFSPPYGLTIKVGSYLITTDPTQVDFTLEIFNSTSPPGADLYRARSLNNSHNVPGLGPLPPLDLVLNDPSGTVLSSTSLSMTPPNPSQFVGPGVLVIWEEGQHFGVVIDQIHGLPTALPTTGLPIVAVNPSQLKFGKQTVGTTSAVHTVTFTNWHAAPVTFIGRSLEGTNPSSFGVVTACQPPKALAPGEQCLFAVTFSPASPGPHTALLVIHTSERDWHVPLSGQGFYRLEASLWDGFYQVKGPGGPEPARLEITRVDQEQFLGTLALKGKLYQIGGRSTDQGVLAFQGVDPTSRESGPHLLVQGRIFSEDRALRLEAHLTLTGRLGEQGTLSLRQVEGPLGGR